MPFAVRYNPTINAIEIHISGIVTENDIQAQMRSSGKLAATYQTSSALVNITNATLQVSIAFIYGLPGLCETMGAKRPIRLAIVNLNEHNNDPVIFYRLVSQNRGWNVEVFSNEQQAQAWLLA